MVLERLRRRPRPVDGRRLRVSVAYAVPPDSRKAAAWHDGFTAAMDLLSEQFEITWLNLHPADPARPEHLDRLADGDCLLVKSNWGWIVDEAVRGHRPRRQPPRGLLVSGTAAPPRPRSMRFYDVLFYETPWYAPALAGHPCRIHAFGVDTTVMRPDPGVARDVDWLSVGALRPYKRHELLLERSGRRVVVGDLTGADRAIVDRLERGGVEIVDFVGYEELARYYRRARHVLVGASLEGGGERSVLEARACGAAVQVLDDNPKLAGLAGEPVVWDAGYYAHRLGHGIEILCGLTPGSARATAH
jgi:glycosyltransferase involved in cell wall biosynthesis